MLLRVDTGRGRIVKVGAAAARTFADKVMMRRQWVQDIVDTYVRDENG